MAVKYKNLQYLFVTVLTAINNWVTAGPD